MLNNHSLIILATRISKMIIFFYHKFLTIHKQGYTQFPYNLDYWYQNTLGMVKARKPDGASVFVVFNRSTNYLRHYIGSASQLNLNNIPNAVPAWSYADVYTISTEVKLQQYSDGSIVFFPTSSHVPWVSPIGRPAYAN